jgi:hypothetical protein
LTGLLHILQPLARLEGRLRHGLTPWRSASVAGKALPLPRRFDRWSEVWREPAERVRSLEERLRAQGALVRRGGEFSRWDLECRGGVLAGVRMTTTVEEHGQGRQLVRLRCWPRWSASALASIAVLVLVAAVAASDGAPAAAVVLGVLAVALTLRTVAEAASAMAATARAFREDGEP